MAAPKAPQPPPVGAWVTYRFKRAGVADSVIRYAVVAGDASGRRRLEIEVEQGGGFARFGYDLMPDGSRARQVAQMGKNGAALLIPNTPLPEPPAAKKAKRAKAPQGKVSKAWRQVTVPAGTFRCHMVANAQGRACIDPGLMPMQVVTFRGGAAGKMTLIGRGFDARPRILVKPRPMPKLDPGMVPTMVPPPLPFTP